MDLKTKIAVVRALRYKILNQDTCKVNLPTDVYAEALKL